MENESNTHAESAETQEVSQESSGATDRGTGSGEELDSATLRKLLSEAREEAASNRVKAREVAQALSERENYVSPDEHSKVASRVADLEAELSRVRLAQKYSLPETIASRITGTTDEERESDAKSLAEELSTLGRSAVRVGKGGLDPTAKADSDPSDIVKRIPRSRF